MAFEKTEFEFPDEQETKKSAKAVEPEESTLEYEVEGEEKPVAVEVVDDTPPKDRNRKPMKEAPEEVSEEELAEYSEKVQHRLKHFSRGYHDERRAKEAALREREEAIRVAQKILEENRALQERLQAHRAEEAKYAKEAAEAARMDAQRKVKAAYEAGDADELVKANEELARAVLRADTAERNAVVAEKPLQAEPPVVVSQPQNARPVVDPRADEWQKENKWFGQDEEMTSFALGLHQKLIRQGVDPRSDEYYDTLNRRMRQVFPDQFNDSEPEPEPKTEGKPKKANVVAPATRSTAPRKVVLNASQVAIAKRLGVPLELYAQKVAEEMRK